MKRRKRWIIALSLSLPAACVGVWKWSERPPYKFMEGATLYFVEMGHTYPSVEAYSAAEYASPEPLDVVVRRAQAEFGRDRFGRERIRDLTHIYGPARTYVWESRVEDGAVAPFMHITISEWLNPGSQLTPDPPPGTLTVIVVDRQPPRAIERLQAWFWALRYNGRRS